jgi:hypothetical protein
MKRISTILVFAVAVTTAFISLMACEDDTTLSPVSPDAGSDAADAARPADAGSDAADAAGPADAASDTASDATDGGG